MIHTILGSEGRAQRTTPRPTPAKSAAHRQNYAARFVHSSGPLRLKSDPNQRSSGHPRIATTSIATIGVPIATMTARIACQCVRNQSTTQSLRTNSASFATLAAMRCASIAIPAIWPVIGMRRRNTNTPTVRAVKRPQCGLHHAMAASVVMMD